MTLPKIAVIDYGMGNLRSVLNALRQVGAEGELVSSPDDLTTYDKIILPGVGAFNEAISNLMRIGMASALSDARKIGVPILGICLGMQLMCRNSEEDGDHQGLGWIDASVRRFPERLGVKVPHIGWNNLVFKRQHFLLDGLSASPDVYFVHSYRVECANASDIVAACDYGEEFTAIFVRENVMGIQFHPEKSQSVGLQILRSFAEKTAC